MSVSAKKRAKALRARYDVPQGVTQAVSESDGFRATCTQFDELTLMSIPSGGTFNQIVECENPAELVVGESAYCQRHWTKHKTPVRR